MKFSLPTLISGAVAGIAQILSFVASAPPELQTQIPQLFPESQRGNIAIWLHVVTVLAGLYAVHAASQAPAAGLEAPSGGAPAAPPAQPLPKP